MYIFHRTITRLPKPTDMIVNTTQQWIDWEQFTYRPYKVPIQLLIATLAPELYVVVNKECSITLDLSDEAISKLIERL